MGGASMDGTAKLVSRRQFLAGGAGLLAGGVIPLRPAAAAPVGGAVHQHAAASALSWLQTTYDLVLLENLSPPAAARTYAYTAIAMYEAVVAGMPRHRSLARQLQGLTTVPKPPQRAVIDWPTALVTAAAAVLREVLPFAGPSTLASLNQAERQAVDARRSAGVSVRRMAASREHGRAVAKHLSRWMARDGQAATVGRAYTPPTGDLWLWESTPPNFRPAIEPYWSEVRPLALRRADEVEPAPPLPFSSEVGSAFYEEAMAPYQQSFVNTEEHKAIARFWTDNPGSFTPPLGTPTGLPSGHWMLIGQQALAARGADLEVAVETFALTGIALHDAFLNCWTWKYRYNLLRPITYVRRYIDSGWNTLINTPQFPEHTSGHSVASPAAATVLTALLGTVAFTDHSHDVRGHTPRSFRSFAHAAAEAAQSRLYGGIHFPHAIDAGLEQGQQVAALVLQRVKTRR